ncbi:MAG TPA: D-alanyl-D-alanine carboxypeptidase family protein [Thiobacillus sp.]|nr:MAG: serine-type D-Ala-D-Ala carboxypeptidase [Hydrogenophilales bacterium 16-64-40]OZA33794.1 MAG: serine-type D-Ala-D-Ala carboxypeptidase [Hydrogenophilales bacterium 17-64-65]HQS83169.1 D-alanyl-D-alanine carboxypeptidase family protein [Thiobacillus sp.]HQT33543.1 D-alanyl-D-alanine carboxypeptidase family protein [Thiobacillus sp.]
MTSPSFLQRLVLIFSLLLAPAAWGADAIPPPPQLAAKSWVLMDVASGSILVDHEGATRLPPASLTKLMTAHVAALELQRGRIKESDLVTISEKAWRMGGSKMFVKVGNQVAVSDLLRGIIVQSGNDASIALAEHLAGGEDTFAALMNQEAKRLGLADTHFLNATGWPAEGHYSSALDMARLARAIVIEDPDHYALYAEKEFVWSGIKQPNRNLLLWRDPTVDGLKTGHTEEAGYCMVASSKRDGMRLVASVFGTDSENARATETAKLLAFGFNFFDSKTFFKQGETVQTLAVWKGAARTVKAGVKADFAAALPKRTSGDYQTRIVLPEDEPVAPIAAGAPLGRVELVSADGKVVMQAPLVALEAVEEGGFFRRMWDSIRLFFKGLLD